MSDPSGLLESGRLPSGSESHHGWPNLKATPVGGDEGTELTVAVAVAVANSIAVTMTMDVAVAVATDGAMTVRGRRGLCL